MVPGSNPGLGELLTRLKISIDLIPAPQSSICMKELAGTLIIRERELLLIYRSDESHWAVPGGKVEESESPTEAAVRETKEEIGVQVELEKPFYSGEFQRDNELFLWHGYLAKTSETPEPQEKQIEKVEWIKENDLEDIELAPNLEQVEPALRKILK